MDSGAGKPDDLEQAMFVHTERAPPPVEGDLDVTRLAPRAQHEKHPARREAQVQASVISGCDGVGPFYPPAAFEPEMVRGQAVGPGRGRENACVPSASVPFTNRSARSAPR